MGSLNSALFSRRLNAEISMPRLHWWSSSNLFANLAFLLGNKSIVKIACWEMKWCWPGSIWLPWLPPTARDSSQSPVRNPSLRWRQKPPTQWGAKEARGPPAPNYLSSLDCFCAHWNSCHWLLLPGLSKAQSKMWICKLRVRAHS